MDFQRAIASMRDLPVSVFKMIGDAKCWNLPMLDLFKLMMEWPAIVEGMSRDGPRRRLDGPRRRLDGPRRCLDGPRRCLDGPRRRQDGPRRCLGGA